ncbi:MAG: PEP-CTERM sorting domain-containing protein [Bryobacterales bacterium]|nr:PEP-CTERM sorting domain-containing protein [Bryobacterales bacterium]
MDTQLRVRYRFTVTADAPLLQWLIDGTVNTSIGTYTNSNLAFGVVTSGQEISGWSPLMRGNLEPVIPAGTDLTHWFLGLTIIDPQSPGRYNITLDIAQLEISAHGDDRGVPEPGSVVLVLAGLAGIGLRRRRARAGLVHDADESL